MSPNVMKLLHYFLFKDDIFEYHPSRSVNFVYFRKFQLYVYFDWVMMSFLVQIQNICYQQNIASVILSERQSAKESIVMPAQGKEAFIMVKEGELSKVAENSGFVAPDQDDNESVVSYGSEDASETQDTGKLPFGSKDNYRILIKMSKKLKFNDDSLLFPYYPFNEMKILCSGENNEAIERPLEDNALNLIFHRLNLRHQHQVQS